MSRDCCVGLPRGDMALYAVCDCVFFLIITNYTGTKSRQHGQLPSEARCPSIGMNLFSNHAL